MAGEMAQWLRLNTVLIEELSLIPSMLALHGHLFSHAQTPNTDMSIFIYICICVYAHIYI